MTNGIRVAKEGKEAVRPVPGDLLYSSEYLSPKIYKTGSGQFTADANGYGSVEIEHGLNYAPVCFVYINPCPSNIRGNTPVWGFINNQLSFVTTFPKKIRISADNGGAKGPNVTYKYKYFIFVDPAKDD